MVKFKFLAHLPVDHIIIIIIIIIIIVNFDYYYYYYYLLLESFSHQRYLMVFLWSLSESKSPQVSSILAVFNNVVVWMVSTHPLISKSSSSFINPLMTVPRASITAGINTAFMFYNLFNSLARSRYLSFFSLTFNFTLWSAGKAKSAILQVPFFIDYYKVWSSG